MPVAEKEDEGASPGAHEHTRGSPAVRLDVLLAAVAVCSIAAIPAARALGPDGEEELSKPGGDTHGAMPMSAQMERLDALVPDRDITVPPPEVDPAIWEFQVPDHNTMSTERVALGRRLYFDTRLSADDTVACATCHDVSRGFTDQRETSEGIGGALGKRNAPTTMNAFFYGTLFLDGRVPDLEGQAALPPINPIEGGHTSRESVIAAISGDPEYERMFEAAYGRKPSYEDMTRAIAAFERTLVFLSSPFDRYLAGDTTAISDEAKRGWILFNGKARCMSCHMLNPSSPIGTDNEFHNIGVAARAQDFEALAIRALEALREQGGGTEAVDRLALETDLSELGRFLVTKNRSDIGGFKTQGIRNVGITAPYMHDGSMRTLWDVMDHYNKGGEPNPYLDGGIEPLALTEEEIDAVVELMFTLTDDRFAEQNREEFRKQKTIARKNRPFRNEAMASREVLPFEQRVMTRPGASE